MKGQTYFLTSLLSLYAQPPSATSYGNVAVIPCGGSMYLLTLILSLYAQPASATSYREVAVILGGGSANVEVYTGTISRRLYFYYLFIFFHNLDRFM
jgi:hypothetical protein